MPRKTIVAALLLALLLAACGDGGEDGGPADEAADTTSADEFEQSYTDVEAYPVFVSNELVVGPNRFVVGLLNDQDAPLADPSIEMGVSFYDISGREPREVASEDMEWVWIEEGQRGYYIGRVEFEQAGELGAEVRLNGGGINEELRAKIKVAPESVTPGYGERPPPVDTPTLADVDKLQEISTDTTPVRRFYEHSIADALDRGQPSVVVFATPKFCASAVCAPTLDKVQEVAPDYPKVSFVHVEPYDLDKIPDELVPVDAMLEWKLPSEPWVFVMDAKGKVVGKYEGVLGDDELRRDLDAAA